MNSLTVLNQRLIAQAVDDTIVDAATENGIISAGADTGGYVDPDEEETSLEVRGRFSTEDPLGFNRVREWIEFEIFNGETTGMAPLIGAFVNDWAEEVAGPDRSRPFAPNLAERVMADAGFQTGASFLPIRSQLDTLPAAFRTEVEADGEMVKVMVVNNPLTGPQFIVEEPVPPPMPDRPIPTTPGIEIGEEDLRRHKVAKHYHDLMRVNMREALPYVPPEKLEEVFTPKPPPSSGGSGGGGRRSIEFDRDQMVSQLSDRYNGWMLDPNPPPAEVIGGIVDRYVREAKAFWSGKGGQLDFETFATNALRALPRYQQVFTHKVPGQTEEEFLASFAQPISQFGQTGEFNRSQTLAGVTSGGAPGEQVKRVSRTREVEMAGGFSGRLAQTLSGIGIG